MCRGFPFPYTGGTIRIVTLTNNSTGGHVVIYAAYARPGQYIVYRNMIVLVIDEPRHRRTVTGERVVHIDCRRHNGKDITAVFSDGAVAWLRTGFNDPGEYGPYGVDPQWYSRKR